MAELRIAERVAKPDETLDPKWEEAGRVHDWRNYVSEEVQAIWPSFTRVQRLALIAQADSQAGRENWE